MSDSCGARRSRGIRSTLDTVHGRTRRRPQVVLRGVSTTTSPIPASRLESRLGQVAFRTELQNGDGIGSGGRANLRVARPAVRDVAGRRHPGRRLRLQTTAPSVQLRAAAAGFGERRRSNTAQFYDGTRTSISTSRGRVQITPQFTLEPGLTLNWVEHAGGRLQRRRSSPREPPTR